MSRSAMGRSRTGLCPPTRVYQAMRGTRTPSWVVPRLVWVVLSDPAYAVSLCSWAGGALRDVGVVPGAPLVSTELTDPAARMRSGAAQRALRPLACRCRGAGCAPSPFPVFLALVGCSPAVSQRAPSPCSMARPGMGAASTPRVAGRLAPRAPAIPALGFNPRPRAGSGCCVWCPTHASNPRRCFNPRPRTGRLPQIQSTTSTPIGRSPVSTCTA